MAQGGVKWNAADYANNASAQTAWAQSLMAQLNLNGNENVLDIGCGDGRISAEIAGLVTGTVVGIDSAEQMVREATAKYSNKNGPLIFRQIDATRLSFKEEFELVFSNAALHWVSDHCAVLAGIKNALRPAGRAVLSMGGKGNAVDILPVVNDLIQTPQWHSFFEGFVFPYAFYGDEEYAQWLPEAGLQAKRIELVPKDMVHDNAAALKGWIRTTWFPYTGRVPQQCREEFIDELVDNYLAQYPLDADGRTHVRMIRLEVEAVKV